MPQKSPQPSKNAAKNPIVLAYDLGGTKVHVGVVDAKGQVLAEERVPVLLSEGKEAVIKQLASLGSDLMKKYPRVLRVGIASAGPLDPEKGVLLDPTNFASAHGRWGKVPLAKLLSTKLKRDVLLENDAAAAILAEAWIGAARGKKNAMILTLGTGLGTGIIANGKLVRAGRGLHPEAGHMILNPYDKTAPCGCGNFGCAEAYLSGRNFENRMRVRFNSPDLTAREFANLAREGNPEAKKAFAEYAELMATAIYNYVMIYAPEVIVFTGSFANAADLFLEATRENVSKRLARHPDFIPELRVSALENQAGLIGGAYVALADGSAH
jgi:glucokinase